MKRGVGILLASCTWCASLAMACDADVIVGHMSPVLADAATPAPMDAAVSGSDAASDASLGDADAAPPLPDITWPSGAHPGNDLQQYLDFGTFRGRPLDIATLYPDRLTGFPALVNPSWPVDMFETFNGTLVLSEPLYPENMGNNQDCVAGTYDAAWVKLGTFLVDRNRADTIIRLGWGMNDSEHPWRADADPSDWVACFRRLVDAIRSTDPDVRIDWSWNSAGAPYVSALDPFSAYPGDDYVDFVGVEVFDSFPPVHTAAEWDAKCNAPTGLCSVIAFARAHGKKLGIGEWGVSSCDAGSSTDVGGDNPFFVRSVVTTFAENADVMGYEAYFEDGGDDVCSSLSGGEHPLAAAEYQRLYHQR